MKSQMIVAVVLIWLVYTAIAASAGPNRPALPSGRATFHTPPPASFTPNRSVLFRGRHPLAVGVIIFPHPPGYLLPPRAVVSSPYFCLYHNEAFVSRIGMIDHLSGMHDLSLTTAASICPDANGECVFPHY